MNDALKAKSKNLMKSLAETGDNGVSQAIYDAIYDMAEIVFGNKGTHLLSAMVEATDGQFYVPDGCAKEFTTRIESLPD